MSTEQRLPSGNAVRPGGLTRYDLLLLTLPLPLLAGLVVGQLLPGSFVEELATGALVAALLMGYAVFVDSPV